MPDPAASPGPRRWRRRLLVLLILAVGLAGFAALQKFKPRPAVRPVVKQLPLVRVQALDFVDGALPVAGHGLVRPRAEVVLGTEVAGRVVEVGASLVSGGSFKTGEVLVRLDAEPFRAALAQAQADRQSAAAALQLAEQLLRRTQELIEKGFLSRQTLDERVAGRDQARAALARTEAVERQRAIDLERTVVRAPFIGRVLAERVDVGDTVQPGRELARIFAERDLEIAVSLTDRDMALVPDLWAKVGKGGADAGVRADARTGSAASVMVEHGGLRYRWPAIVDRVEAAVDSTTRTFNVVVRVHDPTQRGRPDASGAPQGPPLLVGMYASVEVAGRDQGRYALLPRKALRDGDRVWLLTAEDAVTIRQVRVLSVGDESIAVAADGLSEGMRAVVSDLPVVTEGLSVRVVETR